MALPKQPQGKPVESWDDDLDLQGGFFTANASNPPRIQSISVSSRHSIRSESITGDDDWHLPIGKNDQPATVEALQSAKIAGIPIPENVPASALVGGTIQKLGKKKSRKNLDDDWANDLQLPDADAEPLKLKKPQETPALNVNGNDAFDDFDDWAEGSLGIRQGGKHRHSRPRESSNSALSPSMGSAFTFESEEEGLDGLILPTGPLDFQAALKKRKAEEELSQTPPADKSKAQDQDDDFNDLDFGPGDVFDPKKRALNKNVRHNLQTPYRSSPQAKPQATLTFTDKANTRLPRPTGAIRPSRLEPVLEAGATVGRSRRVEASTSAAQALRTKRSMPALRSHHSLTKQASVPSLPSQSHFAKPFGRNQAHARQGSDPNGRISPAPRPLSISRQAPETPTRTRRNVAPPSLTREATSKQTVTQPLRRRHFGNGTELDMFDDLPTSATKEKQYTKQAISKAPSLGLRTTTSQRSLTNREKTSTPLPSTPRSPTRPLDSLPRFARDTAASRIAREQTIGNAAQHTLSNKRSDSVLATRTNWPAQVSARSPHGSPSAQRNAKRGPTLINPMGKENNRHFQDDAARKGMRWNATLLRWEGNDSAVRNFDPAMTPSQATHRPQHSPPRPALITNFPTGQIGQPGIQVVGGMVFDPTRMCWLKMGRGRSGSVASNAMSPVGHETEEDDDPFKDIEDLKDEREKRASSAYGGAVGPGAPAAVANEGLHEEFDLGPAFIARQREEEASWNMRIGGWFSAEFDAQRKAEGESWKWAIVDQANMVDEEMMMQEPPLMGTLDPTVRF